MEKWPKIQNSRHRIYLKKMFFAKKQKKLRYFIALGDTIPEIGPAGSAGKVYIFKLEISKSAKKHKKMQKI